MDWSNKVEHNRLISPANINTRFEWVDCCKGFAMILVVIGHICDGYINAGIFSEHSSQMQLVFNLVYSFHMPLFFCFPVTFLTLHIAEKQGKRKINLRFKL